MLAVAMMGLLPTSLPIVNRNDRLFTLDEVKEAYRMGRKGDGEWTLNQWLDYAVEQRTKNNKEKGR